MVIFRKTYGWNKREDIISLSQFVLSIQIMKPNVIRAVNKLRKRNLIIQTDNAIAKKYRFNKDFQTWRPLSKQITVIQTDNKSLSKQIPTKDNIQKQYIYKPLLEENKEARQFLNHYFNRYKELIHKTRLPVHSDRIILPKIEVAAENFGGYEKLKKMLETYFDKDDKFYKDNKWTLTCFLGEGVLNKLND